MKSIATPRTGSVLVPLAVPALLALAACTTATADPSAGTTHDELVALYGDFRAFIPPEIHDGVPDYTPAAMERKREGLADFQRTLAAFDTAGWDVSEKVDYVLVTAEMNAMDFQHRVLRPWSRDPAFYVVLNFQFGPKMATAGRLPGGGRGAEDQPLDEETVAETRQQLRAMVAVLDQARNNLTEPAGDLALLGVRSKDREEGMMEAFLERIRDTNPELVPDTEAALAAIRSFRDWLEAERGGWTAPAGVGKEDFDWYLKNVLLVPYTWDEAYTHAQRDLERSLAMIALEEHRNRNLPPWRVLHAPEDTEAYRALRTEAGRTLLEFVREEKVFTVPDWLEVSPTTGDINTLPSGEKDYFENIVHRDPIAKIPHDILGHGADAERQRRDDRPIRGQDRAFFLSGSRAEGWSTYAEHLVMALGLLDDRPRARELGWNLLGLRAVRAISDLKMHSNEMSLMEAFQYNVDHTPKGWLPEDSPTMWHDLELYLRQPGYGLGYYIGVPHIERLLADRATQLGDDFDLTTFVDRFLGAGMIPISLIRWEITGLDDEVRGVSQATR